MTDKCEENLTTVLGIWLLIHEVADDIIRDGINESRNKPEENRNALEQLIVDVASEKDELKKDFKDLTTDTLPSTGLVTKEELKKVIERIGKIEEKLEK